MDSSDNHRIEENKYSNKFLKLKNGESSGAGFSEGNDKIGFPEALALIREWAFGPSQFRILANLFQGTY